MFTNKHDLPGEKWRQHQDYKNYYEFSNYGRFRSLDRTIKHKNGVEINRWGKFINPLKLINGTYYVNLSKNGKSKSLVLWKIIHQLFPKLNIDSIKERISLTADIYMPTLLERQIKYYELQNEEWFDIKGYEGIYQICLNGYIKSLLKEKNGRIDEPRILTPCSTKKGYLKVTLTDKEGIQHSKHIHKLMHMMFLEDYKVKGMTIDHVDGNKANNSLSNLQVVTIQENIRRYHEMKKYK